MASKRPHSDSYQNETANFVPDTVPGAKQTCFKSELSYFSQTPLVQECILETTYVRYNPVQSVNVNSNIVEWMIPALPDVAIDATRMNLSADLFIRRDDGVVLGDYKPMTKKELLELEKEKEKEREKERGKDKDKEKDKDKDKEKEKGKEKKDEGPPDLVYDPVALTTLPLDTLFNRTELMLNDHPIFSNSADTHYRAFFEASFNYSNNCKEAKLACAGFKVRQSTLQM
jgi:hypothetical protein